MTSLQDAGRVGQARRGLSRSGAMDRLALAEANVLVGNPPDAAAIEMMLVGGTFVAEGGPVRVAVAGAPMAASVDGRPLSPCTSATLRPGETLQVGGAPIGIFAYLAIGGGPDVPADLGSRSLQPRAGIGGFGGRAFRAGDEIPVAGEPPSGSEMSLPPTDFDPDAPIRVVLGPQDDYFSKEAIRAFLETAYTVSEEADRMGYRLAGPAIAHLDGYNIVSDGIVAGSVQVPGSGVPIVMMSDHQTTGGYPKIATVISADRRLLAQRRSGQGVRFAAMDVAAAQAVARDRARLIADLHDRLRPVASGLPDVETLLGLNLAGDASDALAA